MPSPERKDVACCHAHHGPQPVMGCHSGVSMLRSRPGRRGRARGRQSDVLALVPDAERRALCLASAKRTDSVLACASIRGGTMTRIGIMGAGAIGSVVGGMLAL